MRIEWKSIAWGFAGALAALALGFAAQVAWTDHARTAEMWAFLVAQSQARLAAAVPQGGAGAQVAPPALPVPTPTRVK